MIEVTEYYRDHSSIQKKAPISPIDAVRRKIKK